MQCFRQCAHNKECKSLVLDHSQSGVVCDMFDNTGVGKTLNSDEKWILTNVRMVVPSCMKLQNNLRELITIKYRRYLWETTKFDCKPVIHELLKRT